MSGRAVISVLAGRHSQADRWASERRLAPNEWRYISDDEAALRGRSPEPIIVLNTFWNRTHAQEQWDYLKACGHTLIEVSF